MNEEPTPVTDTGADSGPPPPPPLPAQPAPRRFRPVAGDVVALVYFVVCVGLLVWAIAVSSGDGSDGSMAAVIPALATAPVSFVWLFLPEGAAMLVLAVVLGGLANAALISWCGRALRRGRPDPDAVR
ncbi:SCO4225 family membrane protein [Streptomyces sp. NPDC002787]